MQSFDEHEKTKSWSVFKTDSSLNNTFHFQWLTLTNAAVKEWKKQCPK